MITQKRTVRILRVLAAAAVTAAVAVAAEPPSGSAGLTAPAVAAPPRAADNPLSFADGRVVFDIDWRLTAEYRDNDSDFDDDADAAADTDALLSRFRIGLALRPVPWIKLYAQGQDSRETWSERGREPNVNGAGGNAEFDLRQGYVELANYQEFPVGLSLGRQIFQYGDGRFLADSAWGNVGRSFDGVKLRLQQDAWWAEAFWASVVTIERGEFDERKDDESVTGLYLSSQQVPNHVIDLYGFYLDSDSGPLEGQTTTVGTRIVSRLAKGSPWDYKGEAAFQFGDRHQGTAEVDIAAVALHAALGYTFHDAPWRPRVGLSYDYASGDGDRTDGDSATFRTPYPTSHAWYGRQDIVGLSNIHNPRLSFKVHPTAKLAVTLEYNAFWLDDTADYAYRANGVTPVRRTTPGGQDVRDARASSQLGQEVDLVLDYAVSKNLKLHAGASTFLAGQYLSDTGAGDNAVYYYLQSTLTF